MYREIPRERWADALEAFTERNAQRPTLIEIESPEMGPQRQEHDIPLRGIAYDRRDDRISIMLGELEGVEPHLTHSIPRVKSVALAAGGVGRGLEVVRIAHDDCRTFVWVKES